MRIIALETSTDACSVALLQGDEVISESLLAPRRHAELILPMLERILAEAGLGPSQLDAIAFGRGPGSFVGVRIATSIAQGIAYALDLPVIPVSGLAAMAQAETSARYLLVANDARMNEIYWAAYERRDGEALVFPLTDEAVLPAGHLELPPGLDLPAPDCIGLGTGWLAYAPAMSLRFPGIVIKSQVYPEAREILQFARQDWLAGKVIAADQAEPVYLRNKVTY